MQSLPSTEHPKFDASEPDIESPTPAAEQNRHRTYYLTTSIALILAALTATTTLYHLAQTQPQSRQHPCGRSVSDAKRRGCTFSQLSNTWLPRSCSLIGEEGFTRANDGHDWSYWWDRDGAVEIPAREELEVGDVYWTTTGQHLSHCAFMLKRLVHSIEGGGAEMLDSKTRDVRHTYHCIDMLLNGSRFHPGWDGINTYGPVNVGSCERYA